MKMVKGISLLVSVIMAWILGLGFVRAATDPMDLQALEVIYTSLNSPSQLTGWKANGGDPCSESWKGVVCQGSDVVSMNLAYNNLSGSLPYSINDMILINYLNLSSNSLYQSIGDVFTNHSDLETLDLSFNKFSGDLPPSLSSLPKLSTL
nr:protein STRUBBELIG-RECEPTOR FAMILY 8 [Ipomoea batatas]